MVPPGSVVLYGNTGQLYKAAKYHKITRLKSDTASRKNGFAKRRTASKIQRTASNWKGFTTGSHWHARRNGFTKREQLQKEMASK